MYTFTPKRMYKLLWMLEPPNTLKGHGLAATNNEYARVNNNPITLYITEPDSGIVTLVAFDIGVLTSDQDFGIGTKWVVLPKRTNQEPWRQKFKLQCVRGNGVAVDAKTGTNDTWERLRGGGYGEWIERVPAQNIDTEYWRPEPTEVSASVTFLDGNLGINGVTEPTVGLDDWWMCFKLKNDTGKELTVTYEGESPQIVPMDGEFVIIPKGTDPTDRSVNLSVGDDLALITLKMTKKGGI